MEVAGRAEIGEIEIGDRHLCHDSGIGENVAFGAVGEKEGYPGTCA